MENLNELSTKQLEELLAKRKKEEKAKAEAEKLAYTKERDSTINAIFDEAKELALANARFKEKCHVVMEQQRQKLNNYGGVRSSSKGGFSIIHTNGEIAVTRRRDTDPAWDERATKAVELIRSFLDDTVKKQYQKLHPILMGFLQKNAKGDLEYANVMNLLTHESTFTDERWVQGLKLIKESYGQHFKAYGYEFKNKDRNGKWQSLTLNFSSL